MMTEVIGPNAWSLRKKTPHIQDCRKETEYNDEKKPCKQGEDMQTPQSKASQETNQDGPALVTLH